jgi:hypothetical protein
MSNEQDKKQEKVTQDPGDINEESSSSDGEFKVTVRKLEMPVRPRGVLAE